MEEKLYNIAEAAEMLGVSKNTLRNWDKSGVFKPVLTYGNHRRYKMSDILTFQKEGAKKDEKI